MRKDRVLKSHDVVVLGKLITTESWPTQKEIANTLDLSQSEISHSLKTLEQAGLINLGQKRLNKLAIKEFIIHALKFFYPPQKFGVGRGMKVGPSSSYFAKKVHSDEFDYIWPEADGDARGILISPLLPQLTESIKNDEKLLLFINTVEILRGLGGVRHMQEAQKVLKEILG